MIEVPAVSHRACYGHAMTAASAVLQGEVNASVSRGGKGLVLALNQLNAFLRL